MMVWAFSVGNKVRFDNLAFCGLGVSIFFGKLFDQQRQLTQTIIPNNKIPNSKNEPKKSPETQSFPFGVPRETARPKKNSTVDFRFFTPR